MSMLELMSSIKERGIKQPLTVRWYPTAQKHMIIDGGRRYEAATRLGLEELPCWIQDGDRKEVLIDQIVHNWQRVDLRPFETADALARLRDEHGLQQTELARVTGKPKSEISKLLALCDKVVPEVQQMVRADQDNPLTRRHLYNISKVKPEKQKQIVERVKEQELTARQTEQLVKSASPKIKIRKQPALVARQRRYQTEKADVVITFRRRNFTDDDVQSVIAELQTLTEPKA